MENTTEIFAPTEKPKYFAVKAVFILRIGECLLCPILLAFVIVYVRILKSKMFCHPNLRFLLIIQPILHWTVILINVIYNILQMYNFELSETIEDVFSNLSDCFLIQATTIMLPISIERLYATLYPEKYDHIHQEFPILGIFLIQATTIMLPISIERLYATLYPEKYDHIHQEFPILGICLYILIALIAFILCALRDLHITVAEHSYLVILILFTLAAIFFLVLPYTSRRLFKETVKMRDCTVSARYQTAENLRSAHLLKYISAWKTVIEGG
ncbi:unnamed protein product, partial [Mesorhabditis belari]|uniref:Uncharacterized protein n=1 Tax=Mesorhabditis belari TaxID=2138241 RepID=A0AAF3JB16_9BILA